MPEPLPQPQAHARPWWLSWWRTTELGAYEIHSPWWVSGYRERADGGTDDSICAAVMAPDEDAAREVILASYDTRPADVEWRFVEEMPAGSSPFTDRFPRAGWMRWPDEAPGNPS